MSNQNLMKYVLPGLIAAVFVLAFWPVLQKLSIRWEGGDNNYCYLVVPLFLYSLYGIKVQGSEFKFRGHESKAQSSTEGNVEATGQQPIGKSRF